MQIRISRNENTTGRKYKTCPIPGCGSVIKRVPLHLMKVHGLDIPERRVWLSVKTDMTKRVKPESAVI